MQDGVIESLYCVFKPYGLKDFRGPLDFEDEQARHLASSPLHSLTVVDLDRYAFKAMSTWGDVDHFKHFLPRLLELSLIDPRKFNFFESLLRKLHDADWQSWPRPEREAVEQFLEELWRATLDRPLAYEADDVADMVLCGIGNTRTPLEPFLDQWLANESENAIVHLALFVNLNAPRLRDHRNLWNSFWSNPIGADVVAA